MEKNELFKKFVGKKVLAVSGNVGDDEVEIKFEDNQTLCFKHIPDCCENVRLEEVHGGDLKDLIGEIVFEIREESNASWKSPEYTESHTWTFYIIRTNLVSLTLRWLGESNGYYGEIPAVIINGQEVF